MSLYILDTDTLSIYRRGNPHVRARLESCDRDHGDSVAITVITIEEPLAGWFDLIRRAKSDAQQAHAYEQLADTTRKLANLNILTCDEAAIARFRLLRSLRLNVGGMDLRIAAIALERDGIVVTRKIANFSRIPGLRCENWASPA